MKSICAAINTANLEASLEFYIEGIGYTEQRRMQPSETTTLVFLKDDDEGLLELIYDSKRELPDRNHESIVSIVLDVESVDDTLSKLKDLGYRPERQPIKVPSGAYIAFIKDPNGAVVELIENFA